MVDVAILHNIRWWYWAKLVAAVLSGKRWAVFGGSTMIEGLESRAKGALKRMFFWRGNAVVKAICDGVGM